MTHCVNLERFKGDKQMGRPLNKRFFGEPTEAGNEIKVQFHNGTASVNFAPAADDGAVEMEEAGDDDSFTNAADFEVDGD